MPEGQPNCDLPLDDTKWTLPLHIRTTARQPPTIHSVLSSPLPLIWQPISAQAATIKASVIDLSYTDFINSEDYRLQSLNRCGHSPCKAISLQAPWHWESTDILLALIRGQITFNLHHYQIFTVSYVCTSQGHNIKDGNMPKHTAYQWMKLS